MPKGKIQTNFSRKIRTQEEIRKRLAIIKQYLNKLNPIIEVSFFMIIHL